MGGEAPVYEWPGRRSGPGALASVDFDVGRAAKAQAPIGGIGYAPGAAGGRPDGGAAVRRYQFAGFQASASLML